MAANKTFPFFETINEWHKALNTGLETLHNDFHIFRYEDVMTNLVTETPHYKDAFFHITFATSMDAVLTINDRQFDCKKGGLFFFIAPEQLIHWKRGVSNWTGFVMLIKPKFISYSIQGSQLLKDLAVFEKEGINVSQADKESEVEISKIFEIILREYQGDKSMKFEVIRSYLKILLIQAQRLNEISVDSAVGKRKNDIAYNFQTLVNKYFNTKKSIYEYAQELKINENYLNEIVKKQTGKTASSIIKERIVLEAKCLLLHTKLDIAEIAYELNFDEPSNFMRFFKTYEKLTPTQYRNATSLIN
jgi:AraC family transcriptional regulator, transcriptional activator of pobA